MRPATQDIQWVENSAGQIVGLSLGHDHCAEHEWGIEKLRRALGMTGGMGVEGRTATKAPPFFRFETYKHTLPKARGVKTAQRWPAAVLCVKAHASDWDTDNTATAVEMVKNNRVGFMTSPSDHWYKEERDNISTAWSDDGFIIHVRGEENVKRLTELAALFQENDLALADPSAFAFSRSGMSVIAPSRMLPEEKAHVLAQDEAHAKLMSAAKATGIEQVLADAGKGFYALSPAWTDKSETDVKFFLNPREQHKFNFGWYTVDELKAWANNEGPIIKEAPVPSVSKPRLR